MRVLIRKADHTGDTIIADYDTENAESVQIAEESLNAFFDNCIAKYGKKPTFWAKQIGHKNFTPWSGDLLKVEDVVLFNPLCGG